MILDLINTPIAKMSLEMLRFDVLKFLKHFYMEISHSIGVIVNMEAEHQFFILWTTTFNFVYELTTLMLDLYFMKELRITKLL